jgi:two-component system sensor histidine kinase DesK
MDLERESMARERGAVEVGRRWQTDAHGLERVQRLAWVGVWLVFMAGLFADLLGRHPSPVQVAAGAVASVVFSGLFLAIFWLALGSVRRPPRATFALLAILAVEAIALILAFGAPWVGTLIYVSVSAGSLLPTRRAVATISALAAVSVAFSIAGGSDTGNTVTFFLLTFGIGTMMVFVRQIFALVDDLREARDAVARLAVSEERLRFARDLHDLLGHSLSLIVLKSTLANRLFAADPTAAAGEVRDIERVARQSLEEVRSAVTGYREPGLAVELERARWALATAGVEATVRDSAGALPADVEALFGWAVREGITNVVRHSRARRCVIEARVDRGEARLEIRDDGAGAAADARPGNGLRGLGERAAGVGGRLEAGSPPDGGYRLALVVPVPTPADVPAEALRASPWPVALHEPP